MRILTFLLAAVSCSAMFKKYPGSSVESEIDDQLEMLLTISHDTGSRLSGNTDFYDWLVEQSYGESLPSRFELAWR